MYTSNIREKLKGFNDIEYQAFEEFAFKYHTDIIKNEFLRKADFRIQLQKFINGHSTRVSIYNLDSYVYGINQIETNEIDNTKSNKNIKKVSSWMQLIGLISRDSKLPEKVDLLGPEQIKILNRIIKLTIVLCLSSNKQKTTKKLKVIEDFMKLAMVNSKDNA